MSSEVETSLTISVAKNRGDQKTVRDSSTSVGMTEKVGRSISNVGRLPRHGRISRQTPSANSSWTRLGLFQRSPEGVRKSGGRRCHFAERWTRPINWERNLQFQITNRSAPVFQAAAGSRSRFLQAPDRPSFRIS